ncbi:hypothetical protein Clacol_009013 [Clathrus columnatus]|uniref:Protein BTN n=1 Tax=Clathrus columnatus TaxID=1419009 RepID=A0AAV5AJC4_9AGAM|nr:hypothetical protein Clacol_009013 [Clathrus columnatus]
MTDSFNQHGPLTSPGMETDGRKKQLLYVIILSAALDLVPPATPKGIIAFCNITPGLVAKIGWPYVLKGQIRYRLGELTFLQLSTRYHPLSVGGHAVGYFASGTGAAGLVGAALWWFVRSLGVRLGTGLSAILPLAIPLSYIYLLPQPIELNSSKVIIESSSHANVTSGVSGYIPILPNDTEEDDNEDSSTAYTHDETYVKVALSIGRKWVLLKPLLLRYMLPLTSVYLIEYTINQGISPTLIYPIPSPREHPFLSHFIRSLRDYYPLWQCLHVTFQYFSRTPPLPSKLLPLPAIIQAIIFVMLATESAVGIFDTGSEEFTFFIVFSLISVEGICGGLAYVNTYFHLGQEETSNSDDSDNERTRQEREFKIGSIGFSDSFGILCASLLAVPTELELCKAQVRRGSLVFCPECGTLFDLPTDGENTVKCDQCQHVEPASSFENIEIVTESHPDAFPSALRQARKTQTAKIDSVDALEKVLERCPQCGHGEAYIKQLQLRSADEGSTNLYTTER